MTLRIGALDDDEAVLFTLEAMASSQGWHMSTTTDPDRCLSWIREDAIDLLLLDVHMPRRGGLETLRRIRETGSAVAVLMLTVEERPEIARECLLAGADDFINKPLRLADFSARIRLHERLAQQRREQHWEKNRKGISPETQRRVLEVLRETPGPRDIEDLSARCGLSYPTTHRYLEHLVERGVVIRTPVFQDGKPGRPRMRYALRP